MTHPRRPIWSTVSPLSPGVYHSNGDSIASMADSSPLDSPSLAWRAASSLTMGVTWFLMRSFLFGSSRTQVEGLDGFLDILDQRRDVRARDRGLITGISAVPCL